VVVVEGDGKGMARGWLFIVEIYISIYPAFGSTKPFDIDWPY